MYIHVYINIYVCIYTYVGKTTGTKIYGLFCISYTYVHVIIYDYYHHHYDHYHNQYSHHHPLHHRHCNYHHAPMLVKQRAQKSMGFFVLMMEV
jgi:hypothetical protein